MATKLKKIAALNPPLEVIDSIGKGAMGEVLLCHDPYLDRPLAVKMMQTEFLASHEMRARFAREVQVLSQLKHPNIVDVYGYWEDAGNLYLSMEFLNGWSLRQLLDKALKVQKQERIPLWATLAIIGDVLSGLAHAHADYAHKDLGPVTHRDIKPANIIVGFNGRVTLLDFGISRPSETNQQLTVAQTGTVAYMSPEQVQEQKVSTASDIFSTGTLFWELITGKNPFLGPNAIATCNNILQIQPDLKSIPHSVDPIITQVLLKMLDKNPKKRPSAEEVQSMLEPVYLHWPRNLAPYLGGYVHHVRKPDRILPPTLPKVSIKPAGFTKWLAGATAIGLVVGLLIGKLA